MVKLIVAFMINWQGEITALEKELEKSSVKLSNPEDLIDRAIAKASQLDTLLENGDITDKKMIQNLLFPEGRK